MTRTSALVVGVIGCAMGGRLPAQARRADSLLAAGRLVAAESMYYAAVRARPRDPEARRQLGRYLGQRGAVRVGTVLLEEARLFGGDAATIARDLVPLYRRLDDFHALAALPASPLGEGDRAQTAWLVAHPPALESADTVASAPYQAPTAASPLGRVVLRIDGKPVDALIDPTRRGIALDDRAAAAPRRRFAARADLSVPAVADTVQIGALKMANVPVSVERLPERVDAAIGLDVLQRFAVTFDPRASKLMLRVAGSVPASTPGIRLPTLTTPTEVRVLQGARFVPITSPQLATLLRTKRWTLDAKRGAVIIQD